MNILKIFSRKKVYTSIKNLPISIWWKVTKEGKFELLAIKGEYSNEELYNFYLDLLQEYYDEFGNSDEHKAFIKAKFKYADKLADYIIKQNHESKMFLDMAKIEMIELSPKQLPQQEERKLYSHINDIEKIFSGCEKDEDKLTTFKYYAYQKSLEEHYKNSVNNG